MRGRIEAREEVLTRCVYRCCVDPRACGGPAARRPGSAARSAGRRSATPRRGSATRICGGRVSSSRSCARATGTAAFSSSFPSAPSPRARRPKPSSTAAARHRPDRLGEGRGEGRRRPPACLSPLQSLSLASGRLEASLDVFVSPRRGESTTTTTTAAAAEETRDHSTFDRIKLKPHETRRICLRRVRPRRLALAHVTR